MLCKRLRAANVFYIVFFLIILVSAVSYIVSPIDLVPDFIPVVGLIDDMAIVSICINSTRTELDKYLAWREQNGCTTTSDEV